MENKTIEDFETEKQIEPTQENNRVLSEFIAIKIKQGMKKKYPNACDILQELNKR